jgi:3-deoxy-D-manno-octulosonate 8-phosphate phosphatase (KDO 8-P phosphatase)
MSYQVFKDNGGQFITQPDALDTKLTKIKALIFDWDGVFNRGEKGTVPSPFNETDSMGINMMRFGRFLMQDVIPFTAIVTGETNQTAFNWAKRENLDHVFYQVKNKVQILSYLKNRYSIEKDEILFVFDDILDLSLAAESGARFLVSRKANPLFTDYCIRKSCVDYITFSTGGDYVLREISELVLALWGMFDTTLDRRIAFDDRYQEFLAMKKQINTEILKSDNNDFIKSEF